MAISYVSDSSNTGAGSTSLTVTAPGSIQDNDILVAFGAVYDFEGGADINVPFGFTEIATNNKSSLYHCAIGWKRASSESGNYIFGTSGGYHAACIVVLRGCTTSGSPVDVYSNTNYTTYNGTIRAAAVTTTVANTMLIAAGYVGNLASVFSPPSGMTEVVDVTDYVTMSIFAAYVAQASTGSSGSKDAADGETSAKHAFLVAFKPASAGNPWYAYAQQ